MAKRRWTVVLVPHTSEPSKIVEVSYGVLRSLTAVVGVVAVLALLLGYAAVSRTADQQRTSRLRQENVRLEQQLGQINGRLATLTDTLSRIAQRDARIRVLANLEPIDPQVQAAGVGGPAEPTPPGAAETPAIRQSHEIRVDLNGLIRRANLLALSFREAADSLATHSARLAATPSIMPTQGWLTSAFSSMREHPILHLSRPHEGIDVATPMGTPIEAPASGVVAFSGRETGYGNVIIIDHGFGIRTKYAHCSKLIVGTGARVTRGQQIALVGNTGLSTGPHLHYEVLVNGAPVDPLRYVLSDRAIVD